MQKIDCSGMKCPLPVITVKRALDSGAQGLEIVVDNDIARQNVVKLLASYGIKATCVQQDNKHIVTCPTPASNHQSPTTNLQPPISNHQPPTIVYLITSDVLGDGDAALGKVLMRSLLFAISERNAPRAIIFMNRGVFLTTQDTPYLETLHKIAANGCELLSCGTCLDFYHLQDKLVVGEPGNMFTALEIMEANSVIKI